MSAQERRVQPVSQATPLAESLLGFLQGQIQPGAGGIQPLTPLQRQAGNFLQNFLALGPNQLSPLLQNLEAVQRRRVGEGAADIREGFSIGGTRFGTPAAVGEARFREGLEEIFGAQIGQLLLGQQAQQIQAAGTAGNIAAQNIAPFVQLAGLGILPEQIFFEQNPFLTGLQTVGGLAGGAAGLVGGLGPFGAGLIGPNITDIFGGGTPAGTTGTAIPGTVLPPAIPPLG